MGKLNNKIAVVTDATHGIGYVTALALSHEGAEVIITGQEKQDLIKASHKIGCVGILCDQAELSSVGFLAREIAQRYGKIDILFANADLQQLLGTSESGLREFSMRWQANLLGSLSGLEHLVPLVANGGSIVLNGLLPIYPGFCGFIDFALCRQAIASSNSSLADTLASRSVRINVLTKGTTPDPSWQSVHVALKVIFISSADALGITGTEVPIDGEEERRARFRNERSLQSLSAPRQYSDLTGQLKSKK